MPEISEELLHKIHEKVMKIIINRHLKGGRFLLHGQFYTETDFRIVTTNLEKYKSNIFIVSKFRNVKLECRNVDIKKFYYAYDMNGNEVEYKLNEYPRNFSDTLETIKDYSDWFKEPNE